MTTLDADFDGAVRRITRTYNSRGLPELVTQYDNATVGSGSVVDEVKYSYENWGLVSAFEQDRNSAVGAGGSVDDYEVSYTYEKSTPGRNTIRRDFVTLPSGNSLEYQYRNAAGLHDEEASRVTLIVEGTTALVNYRYNGLASVVDTYYYEPDVMSRQYGTTSGSYPDLDRFNRVTTSKWTKDLATDVDFYSVALAYDRNSNITAAEDNVHSGFDVLYTNDSLNRLVRAEEGSLSGGSISSRTRDQQWTLTQVGNWEEDKLDLNGDGDFVDTDEWDDSRTHNDVNELLARDLDSDSTDDHTLTYDEAGNLTDDGENYTYVWDAFYRLRKIKGRGTGDLVAEYKYNGLGYRISIHEDTDTDGDVDGSDLWYHHAFDEQWRWVGTFRDTDSDPKEEFLHHGAGLDGFGGASYIDLVVYRDRDANTAWTSASDGTLEERIYYCQNWRADVSALVTDTGTMLEWVKYSAYGVPFGLPGGDTDSDGDCDSTDVAQVQTWIDAPAYDVRGDIDLDGGVDSADKSVIQTGYQGMTGMGGVATLHAYGNCRAFAGYTSSVGSISMLLARSRWLSPERGGWLSRDRAAFSESANLYEYARSQPVNRLDASGFSSVLPGYGGLSRWDEKAWEDYKKKKACCDTYDNDSNGKGPDPFDPGKTAPKKGAGWVCCGGEAIPCNFDGDKPIHPLAPGASTTAGMIAESCQASHELSHAGDIGNCLGVGDGIDPGWSDDFKNPDGSLNADKIAANEIAKASDQLKCIDDQSSKCGAPGVIPSTASCLNELSGYQNAIGDVLAYWESVASGR